MGDAGLPDEAEFVGDDGVGLGVAPLPQILPRGHGAQRHGGVAAAANSIHVPSYIKTNSLRNAIRPASVAPDLFPDPSPRPALTRACSGVSPSAFDGCVRPCCFS